MSAETESMAAWDDVERGYCGVDDDKGGHVSPIRERRSTWKQRAGFYRRRSPQSRADRDRHIETLKAQYGTPELLLSWLATNGTITTDPRRDMDWLRRLCLDLHAAGRIVRDRSRAQTRKSAYQSFKLPTPSTAEADQ
jgi:hypothetical protein